MVHNGDGVLAYWNPSVRTLLIQRACSRLSWIVVRSKRLIPKRCWFCSIMLIYFRKEPTRNASLWFHVRSQNAKQCLWKLSPSLLGITLCEVQSLLKLFTFQKTIRGGGTFHAYRCYSRTYSGRINEINREILRWLAIEALSIATSKARKCMLDSHDAWLTTLAVRMTIEPTPFITETFYRIFRKTNSNRLTLSLCLAILKI